MSTLALFDIDGTLLLTGGAGARAMNRAFADLFGGERGFDGIPMAGRTDPQIVEDALRRAGIRAEPRHLDRFRASYLVRLRQELGIPNEQSRVMPGVRPLLDRLVADPDVVVGLLTGNFADGARIKLQHFGLWEYFRVGAFGDDAPERADLVGVALARARANGIRMHEPADVVIIGDTPLDVACAKANGARAIAVATGPYDITTLRESGADAVVATLADTGAVFDLIAGPAEVRVSQAGDETAVPHGGSDRG